MRKNSHWLAFSGVWSLFLLVAAGLSFGQPVIRPGERTASADTETAEPDESWEVIYFGDVRVGYARYTSRPVTEDRRTILHTETQMHLVIKRFGQELTMDHDLSTRETDDGELLSFVFELRNPPAGVTRTEGTMQRDLDGKPKLVLEMTVGGRKTKSTLPWDPEAKSPAYQDRLLSEKPLKPGASHTFKTFLPELTSFSTVKMVADDYGPVKLLDGQQRQALKVRITESVMPTVTTRAYLDADGEVLKTERDLLGMTMTTYSVPKDVALEAIAGAELDFAVSTLVKVSRIRDAHQSKKIVYQITIPGDDPGRHIVSGPTQQVVRTSADSAQVTVTALPIPRFARLRKTAPEFLADTRYLQHSDARVREHARHAAGNETDPGRIAVQMERYVYEHLAKKNFSTALASAAEVAEKLEGDCTEHAVLLAAMLRAAKIPSRIAVGVVYVDRLESFGGHMWTEAFIGDQWIPLDATLGLGGIGAGHIKLGESSFADDDTSPFLTFLPLMDVLGKIQIEVVSPKK